MLCLNFCGAERLILQIELKRKGRTNSNPVRFSSGTLEGKKNQGFQFLNNDHFPKKKIVFIRSNHSRYKSKLKTIRLTLLILYKNAWNCAWTFEELKKYSEHIFHKHLEKWSVLEAHWYKCLCFAKTSKCTFMTHARCWPHRSSHSSSLLW